MTLPRLSEKQELALLDHAAEAHGLKSFDCPACNGLGCRACNGDGFVWRVPAPTCADPRCALTARMAAIAAEERS